VQHGSGEDLLACRHRLKYAQPEPFLAAQVIGSQIARATQVSTRVGQSPNRAAPSGQKVQGGRTRDRVAERILSDLATE
jgi:hypothetical protein